MSDLEKTNFEFEVEAIAKHLSSGIKSRPLSGQARDFEVLTGSFRIQKAVENALVKAIVPTSQSSGNGGEEKSSEMVSFSNELPSIYASALGILKPAMENAILEHSPKLSKKQRVACRTLVSQLLGIRIQTIIRHSYQYSVTGLIRELGEDPLRTINLKTAIATVRAKQAAKPENFDGDEANLATPNQARLNYCVDYYTALALYENFEEQAGERLFEMVEEYYPNTSDEQILKMTQKLSPALLELWDRVTTEPPERLEPLTLTARVLDLQKDPEVAANVEDLIKSVLAESAVGGSGDDN
jgi:hypothetical protein